MLPFKIHRALYRIFGLHLILCAVVDECFIVLILAFQVSILVPSECR